MEFRNWVQGLLGIGDGVLEPDSRSLLSGVEPRRAAGVGWLSVHRASAPERSAHAGATSDDVLALPSTAVAALPTAPSPARARSVVNSRFVTPATHSGGAQRRPPPTAPAATHPTAAAPRAPPVPYARPRPALPPARPRALPPPARAPQQQLVRHHQQQQQPKSGGARFLVQAYRGAARPHTGAPAKPAMPRNVRAVVVRATPGAAGLLQRALSGFQRGAGGRSGMRLRA